MKPTTETQQDHLTVIVFKDRLSARSFQVSLDWISKMGWGVALLMTLWLLSTLLAVKYYVKSTTLPSTGSQKELSHRPISPVTMPSQNTEAVNAQPAPGASGLFLLFRDLPARVQLRESSSIGIENLQFDYRGNYLTVRFNLRYNLTDGGRQQGHFIILARGAETLMTYPDGVLNLSTDRVLFSPDRGEYYSVGKFREVEATFPAPRKKATFKELQVLVFDEEDQLIRQQVLQLQISGGGGQTLPRPVVPQPQAVEESATSTESGHSAAPATEAQPASGAQKTSQ